MTRKPAKTSAPATPWQRTILAQWGSGSPALTVTHVARFEATGNMPVDQERFINATATAMRCCAAFGLQTDIDTTGRTEVSLDPFLAETMASQLKANPTKAVHSKMSSIKLDFGTDSSITLTLNVSRLVFDVASYHNFMLCLDEAYNGEPLYPEGFTFIDHAHSLCKQTPSIACPKTRHANTLLTKHYETLIPANVIAVQSEDLTPICAGLFALCLSKNGFLPNGMTFAVSHNMRGERERASYTTGPLTAHKPITIGREEMAGHANDARFLSRLCGEKLSAPTATVDGTEFSTKCSVGFFADMLCHRNACNATVTETISSLAAPDDDFALAVFIDKNQSIVLRTEHNAKIFSESQIDDFAEDYKSALADTLQALSEERCH